ncbi:M56 family metallopeptidase [Cryobacterium zhongshanensis]|uniref:M48 family metalloprotease n=1 Tax=Cryobacterium zhongshanensis TaxID=2928153 RepID=A0AA41UFG1_9MICO|nr:M56 family metallopeptidase [Cryobacterium zhongshanensis]MCI4658583.1 M48 family metalloprotease [Cryobacterium zhongshanensis]
MLTTALCLGLLAIVLAWPVPVLLARAAWPAGSPGVALVLWQSIALAGGLAMIGALFVYGLIPFGANPVSGIRSLADHLVTGSIPAGTSLDHVLALCGALLLGGHLVLNLVVTIVHAERQQRRHLNLVRLLSEPLEGRPSTRVIDHAAPVAYCLPSVTHSATVLSRGLLSLLDAGQVLAVVAHEEAHLAQRHHLVLVAFKSWHNALPWFPIANRAENAVALLVEMLADDQARRAVGDHTLAAAIALVGSAGLDRAQGPHSPTETADAAAFVSRDRPVDLVTPRVRRLLTPPPRLSAAASVAVIGSAAALLVLPALLLAQA